MCKCGCNTCDIKPLMLNESLAPREILSEGLKYHMDNKKPLTEHMYRAGSTEYFNLWAEARSLYSRNILEIANPDDLAILTETNLGEFGVIYEIEIGDQVKASKEYGGLSGEVVDVKGSFIVVKTKEGNQSYHESDLKVLNKEGKKVPLDFIMEDEYLDLNEINLKSAGVRDAIEKLKVHFKELGFPSLKAAIDFIKGGSIEDWEEIRGELAALTEAKTGKKKDPPVGKPMRDSSGGKAYKVYVRDPKTKKIKTVRFGSGGLRAKINDPKARQAFAKRHKCSTRNDKTKASYWSYRLPRYAKLLGLKSSFSGFW